MAHIANVVCLFGFWRAGKMHEEGLWNDEAPVEAEDKNGDEKFPEKNEQGIVVLVGGDGLARLGWFGFPWAKVTVGHCSNR